MWQGGVRMGNKEVGDDMQEIKRVHEWQRPDGKKEETGELVHEKRRARSGCSLATV